MRHWPHAWAGAGDTLVVTKLDRLARSLPDARAFAEELTAPQVSLSLGGSVYDPTDAVGRLLFNVLAMVAEFESDLIRLRTKEGMRVAKAKGRLRGKQPKLNRQQYPTILDTHRVSGQPQAHLRTLSGRVAVRPLLFIEPDQCPMPRSLVVSRCVVVVLAVSTRHKAAQPRRTVRRGGGGTVARSNQARSVRRTPSPVRWLPAGKTATIPFGTTAGSQNRAASPWRVRVVGRTAAIPRSRIARQTATSRESKMYGVVAATARSPRCIKIGRESGEVSSRMNR